MKKYYDLIIKDTRFGSYIHRFLIRRYYNFLSLLNDKQFAVFLFNKNFSFKLNLDNPRSLNEKIQWLKLFERTELHTLCADKFKVRGYVQKKLGSDNILIPLLYDTDCSEDLTPGNLPNTPMILKTNHTSGHYHIVRKPETCDWDSIRADFSKWLTENIYSTRREWQYKNIPPRIVVEKLLVDEAGNVPDDFKFHCFHGEVKFFQVDMGRGTETHNRNWYNTDWTRTNFDWKSKFKSGYTEVVDADVEIPKNFDAMLKIAEILSQDFKYVRVDLYNHLGEIYFGEITFHHDGGFKPIIPVEYDFKLGDLLKL